MSTVWLEVTSGTVCSRAGAVAALREQDWLFPTYRTPLATNTLHAVGVAHAARFKGEDSVSLVLLGDGATSEGDTHEALNFAGVRQAPVVFLVQNNGYAISVPMSRQNIAPSLAHKGIGYDVPALLIDGNDPAAVYSAVRDAVEIARSGGGPTLIEAITYRIEAHTNARSAGWATCVA